MVSSVTGLDLPACGADPTMQASVACRSPRDERGMALSATSIGLAIFLLLYIPIITYLYGRLGRWWGAAGWILIVAGIAAFGTGVSQSFTWGGLTFGFVVAVGGLLLLIDVSPRLRRR